MIVVIKVICGFVAGVIVGTWHRNRRRPNLADLGISVGGSSEDGYQ